MLDLGIPYDQVDDVFQEGLEDVTTNIDRYLQDRPIGRETGRASVGVFAFSCVRNEARNHARRVEKSALRLIQLREELTRLYLEQMQEPPSEATANSEAIEAIIWEAIEKLPLALQPLVKLRLEHPELEYKDLAPRVKLSVGQFRYRMGDIMRRMKNYITNNYPGIIRDVFRYKESAKMAG